MQIEVSNKPVLSAAGVRNAKDMDSPANVSRAKEHVIVPLVVGVSTTDVDVVDKGTPSISVQPVSSPAGVFTTMDVEAPVDLTSYIVVEAFTAGVGVIDQGTSLRVTSAVIEVYRRRDGTVPMPLKGIGAAAMEVGLELCETREKQICASLDSGLSEGDATGGGLETDDPGYGLLLLGESSLWRRDSGGASKVPPMPAGVVSKVLEDSPFSKELSLAMEVSRVVGVSCDG